MSVRERRIRAGESGSPTIGRHAARVQEALAAMTRNPVRRTDNQPSGSAGRKARTIKAVMRAARRRAVRWATSPAALRSPLVSWSYEVLVAAPGLPDRVRFDLLVRAQQGLLRNGQPARAARVRSRALARTRDPRARVDLLMRLVDAELGGGTPPSLPEAAAAGLALARTRDPRARVDLLMRLVDAELGGGTPPSLPEAAAAGLALADERLADGNVPGAAGALQAVQRRLFHRRLHFDRLSSPLAEDPSHYLAAWHASTAVRALSAPRGRSATVAGTPTGRPVRLLLATYGNHGFLAAIRRHFEQSPDVELRFLDPGDAPDASAHVPMLTDSRAMLEHALAGRSAFGDRVAEWLAPHVEWADVVFVDWCAGLAVLFSMLDPGPTRIIVRLHSFEAFALWPHLVDFARVDDVIFVSDHLRDLATAAVPGLAAGPRLHVISNAMDLRACRRAKRPGARFTLGLVGIKSIAKDPRWAVEVLRHLRAQDDRYRLELFGSEPAPEASPDTRRYWTGLLAEIGDLEAAGAVVRRGQVEDMPEALRDVGVVLSSSVRESFHCGLVEGAASAAVPVVRDWPFFAGRPASARTLFPADWVVDTPREAADRIRALTATEDGWRAAGEAASAHALGWDWEVVKHLFDRLVSGPAEVTAAERGGLERAG